MRPETPARAWIVETAGTIAEPDSSSMSRAETSDRTRRLTESRARHVPAAYPQHHPIIAAIGEGAWIEDTDGRRYLDFAGGIGVLNAGQRHHEVVQALHRQTDRLLHSGPVMIHEGYIELAERIAERVAPDGEHQVLFLSSGAEAVENAVKVARHATGRPAVISFEGSFHGRTLLTSTMTGKAMPYKAQPSALAPEVHHAVYPYPYRPPRGVAPEALADFCLDSLERLVFTQVPASKVAAVIIEPIQGEGGYIVPPRGFLSAVKEFCQSIGALLIVDEIQTGYGRTGRMFAYEWEPVEPDILTLGKSIADGLPLAAVVASRGIFDRVVAGDIGGTFGGNPLACAAALAVLDVLDADLLSRSAAASTYVRSALKAMSEQVEAIGDVRGLGAMLAIELVTDRDSKTPAGEVTEKVIARARENGLIVIKAGTLGNVIRLLPPLSAGPADLEKGMAMLAAALHSVCRQAALP